MPFNTFTRLFTLGVFYDFGKSGGLETTVINTGVQTFRPCLHIGTGCRVITAMAGDPAAKLALGINSTGIGSWGTYSIVFGNVLLQPQATEVLNVENILMQINDGEITAGKIHFTFMFLLSVE